MSVQSCTPTEMVRVSLASKLELNCASPCDPKLPQQYEWTKVGEGKHVEQLAIQGQALVISSIGYKDKGTYKCRCLTGETWCEQTVYGKKNGDKGNHKVLNNVLSIYSPCFVYYWLTCLLT